MALSDLKFYPNKARILNECSMRKVVANKTQLDMRK